MPLGHELSQAELDQRVAVLKRFRELLASQRDKFRSYMNLLDHQKRDIESGDVDALVAHVEAEQGIVAEIFAVQKVIAPLEDMYRAVYTAGGVGTEASQALAGDTTGINASGDGPHGISELKNTLETLKNEVVQRNAENQALLKQRMDMLRHQIMSVNNPYTKRKSVYTQAPEPENLDIRG
ncbi:MAG: flagellar biosynthesis protein FlgN [Spirochaetota bacterium]